MAKKATVVHVIDDDESVRRVLARLLRSAEEMYRPMVGAGFFPPAMTQKFVNVHGSWKLCPSFESPPMIKPCWMPSGGVFRERGEITKGD